MHERFLTRRTRGRLSVLVPPVGDLLNLELEVKPHLRVETVDDDTSIKIAINAAIGLIDSPKGWLGRSLLPRTLRMTFDRFPPDVIFLRGVPVTSIVQIQYRDDDDVIQVLDSVANPFFTDLNAEPALLWIGDEGWPTDIKGGPDSLRIDYIAGYADADAVPDDIKQFLLIRIADLYRDRESEVLNAQPNKIDHIARMLDHLKVR